MFCFKHTAWDAVVAKPEPEMLLRQRLYSICKLDTTSKLIKFINTPNEGLTRLKMNMHSFSTLWLVYLSNLIAHHKIITVFNNITHQTARVHGAGGVRLHPEGDPDGEEEGRLRQEAAPQERQGRRGRKSGERQNRKSRLP